MPNVIVAVAVIRSHSKQIGRKSRAVPIATRLIQGMRPRVTQNVGHAMPGALCQRRLKSVVVAEILVGDVVDVREVWELPEVRPPQVFTRRAARSSTHNLSRSVRRIARGARGPRQPAGTRQWRIDVI